MKNISEDINSVINHADDVPSSELLKALNTPTALFNKVGKVHSFSAPCHAIFNSSNDGECRQLLESYFELVDTISDQNGICVQHGLPDADFQSVGDTGSVLVTFVPNDPVTNLLTRSRFIRHLDHALSNDNESGSIVLCIQLDKLNDFKSEVGETAGDRLLQKVSSRLTDILPANWLIASTGASSFVVLTKAEENSESKSFDAIVTNVKEMLNRPYLIDGEVAELNAHIGWAKAENNIDSLELLRRADLSLSVNSRSNSGIDQAYLPSMDERRKEERKLEFDLRKAILLNEFELHYQMQLDYTNRKISGFEALIRWRHPERGMIFPDVFIPIAEKSGLIVAMGEWVIKTACKQAIFWPEDIRVAVNVSPVQLQSENLLSVIDSSLRDSGLTANRLEIEITESTAIQDETSSRQRLMALKELGISIALDDFGTGYASLSYLRSFPFDKLKIDQSFIRSEENRVQNDLVLQSMFTLGKCFGMTTLAEGIETEEHQEKILGLGCDKAQGYLYSRPIPFEDTFSLIEEFNNVVLTAPNLENSQASKGVIEKCANGGLFQIAYISDNATGSTSEELSKIMQSIQLASKRNNTADNISGALMFNQQCFAQILEGDSKTIENTFERIQNDPRHQNVQVLDYGPIQDRSFPEWAMAFVGETNENTQQFSQLSFISNLGGEQNQGSKLQKIMLELVENTVPNSKAA